MKMLKNILVVWLWFAPLAAISAPMIDINTADSEALVDGLEGVGPQKAMAIVRYRQENGPFETVDDLAQVSGIGPRTVEQNRSWIAVTESGTEQKSESTP